MTDVRVQWRSSKPAAATTHSPSCVFAGGDLCSCAGARPGLFGTGAEGRREGEGGEGEGGEGGWAGWVQIHDGDSKVAGGKGYRSHVERWLLLLLLLQRERFAAFNCGASPSSRPLTVRPHAGGATAPVRGLPRSQQRLRPCGASSYRGQTRPPLCDGARYRDPTPAPLPTLLTGRGPGGREVEGRRRRRREGGTGTPRGSR